MIAPPGRHASGHRYRWHDPEQHIAALPAWLAALQAPPRPSQRPRAVSPALVSRYVQAALEGELRRIATAPPHTRNNTVNRAAFRLGQLAGAGLASPEVLRAALVEAALAVGQGQREALATVDSGLSAGLRRPRLIRAKSRS